MSLVKITLAFCAAAAASGSPVSGYPVNNSLVEMNAAENVWVKLNMSYAQLEQPRMEKLEGPPFESNNEEKPLDEKLQLRSLMITDAPLHFNLTGNLQMDCYPALSEAMLVKLDRLSQKIKNLLAETCSIVNKAAGILYQSS
jgi:hypothetical protein